MDQVFNISQLLDDLKTWMLGLVPTVGAIMIAYHAIMKNAATDEHEAASHGRSLRGVTIGTAVGLAAAGIVHFIQQYVPGAGPQ